MSNKTVTIGPDGSLIVSKTDDGVTTAETQVPGGHHYSSGSDHPDPASVMLGMVLGAGGYWWAMRRRNRRRHRPVDLDRGTAATTDQARMAADVAALAKRTATLETIVTDPAQRTAREIDALR